jgi:hypothetical protein
MSYYVLSLKSIAPFQCPSPHRCVLVDSFSFRLSTNDCFAFLQVAEPIAAEPALVCGKTLDERYSIARSVGEECIQEDELRVLLSKKPEPICYDGFEPSGRMHIAQGILKSINVNKLTSVGCRFIFWVADWFAMLNNKMGGDLNKIQKVGEYLIEVYFTFLSVSDCWWSLQSRFHRFGKPPAWTWSEWSSVGPARRSTSARTSTGPK